jgi:hypothetical protein
MSGHIETREFSISDYDAALELWQRVEGLEIAPRLLASHCAVTTDAADIFIIWQLILLTKHAELAGV